MAERKAGQTRVRMRSVEAGKSRSHIDLLATEEPMEIRIRHGHDVQPIAVTMRTPGADFELAAGFLFAEGLIESRHEIARIEYCLDCEDAEQRYNIVTAVLRGNGQKAMGNRDGALGTRHSALGEGQKAKGKRQQDEALGTGHSALGSSGLDRGESSLVRDKSELADNPPLTINYQPSTINHAPSTIPHAPTRNFAMTSACGLCGKERLDDIERRGIAPLGPGPVVGWETIVALPEKLREAQGLFSTTGGLHAAALFTAEGELLAVREDVGRHNAVDKVVGWAFLEGLLPLNRHILMVSGRSSFEIAQKALAAGIPVLCAVSAPSSLAADLAQRFGMTLVGFLRGERFNVYAGAGRIAAGGKGDV